MEAEHRESLLDLSNWEEFATVKMWKKGLTRKSKDKKLSEGTWKSVRYRMPVFLKLHNMTPDELIEEALKDSILGNDRADEFYNHLKDDLGLDASSSHIAAYGVIRGFYSHNRIDTRGWITPIAPPKKVEVTDANYPLYKIIQIDGSDGKKSKKLVLNRELVKEFESYLNYRDKLIRGILHSASMDIGDLLRLTVGWVRSQDGHERLFYYTYRDKSNEIQKTFVSAIYTKMLRDYVTKDRFDALDSDPLFVNLLKDRKRKFHLQNHRKWTLGDPLPKAEKISEEVVSQNFREAQRNMGIPLEKKVQSPYRPKRWRKVFKSAATKAGIDVELRRVFMGKADKSEKEYVGKSREELEYYYEVMEPEFDIYSDSQNDEEIEKIKAEYSSKISSMEEHIAELQDDSERRDNIAVNAIRELQKQVEELQEEKRKSPSKNVEQEQKKKK